MNNFIERKHVIKIYPSCNKVCPFCFSDVTLKDVYNDNYIYSETKRKTKLLAHRICFERKLRP